MPIYTLQGPDGRTYDIEGPAGATVDQLAAFVQSQPAPQKSLTERAVGGFVQGSKDLAGGLLRGAGSIGSTLMLPGDAIKDAMAGRPLMSSNIERRNAIDQGAQSLLGSNPDSFVYGAGKLTGEIAGTAGVGPALAGGARMMGAAPAVVEALSTGGMQAGGATGLGGAALRAGAGAITGGASAGLVDPRQAGAGAVIGGVAPTAIKGAASVMDATARGAQGVARGARALAEPFSQSGRQAIAARTVATAAGDDAANVANRLAGAAELVPGSAPTAGQIADNGGVAALERAMAARNPAPFAERVADQTAARAAAVQGIAGDVAQQEAAALARQQTAAPLYEKAFATPINLQTLTPEMRAEAQALMQTPAIKQALRDAQQNAMNRGARPEAYTIRSMHDAKLALDDMISSLGGSAAQQNKAQAVAAARDRLLAFMEAASPEYAQARSTYAQMSQPINQMEVGQQLLNKLQPALGEAGAATRENGAAFAQALRNGDQMVKQATGRRLPFDQVMSPEQQSTLRNVTVDLARKANAQDLGRGVGSNTFQNLAMNNVAEQAGAPRAISALFNIPVVSKIPELVYQRPNQQIEQEIIRSLLEPKSGADVMRQEIARRALQASRPGVLSPDARAGVELLFGRTSPVALSGQ